MPDLSHLWQRFLLASSLLVGLFIGIVVTVFGYSNLTSVDVRWSILHVDGVPLWTVPVVPLAIVLVAGTLYHWTDSLHHFSEHMRHRRRVHELEAEVASLRAHMDQVLEMPDQSTSRLPRKPTTAEPVPEVAAAPSPALPEATVDEVPAPADGGTETAHPRAARPKRVTLAVAAEPAVAAEQAEPAAVTSNGGQEAAPAESAPEA